MKSHFTQDKTVRKVIRTISAYQMIDNGDAILAGVSGGPDSVALLHILSCLSEVIPFRLGVAHFNHGLRKTASDDEQFVATLAEQFGLPFFRGQGEVKTYARKKRLSVEEAARWRRYTFLYGVSEKGGFNRIALGHHSDDNAELVLMFLLRGSGPLGISGIPPVRGRCVIRPLIDLDRHEILNYLRCRELSFVTDPSNTDMRHFRNRIRHQLMPQLNASFNPETPQTLNRLSKIIRDEDQWMEAFLEPMLKASIISKTRDCMALDAKYLRSQHVAVQRRLLRKAVSGVKGDLRRIGFQHVEAAIRLLGRASGEGTLHLPHQISLKCEGGRVVITRERIPLRRLGKEPGGDTFPGFEYTVPRNGSVAITEIGACLKLSEIDVSMVPAEYKGHVNTAYFDGRCVGFPMIVRNYRSGDRFRPLGMMGSKKVKDFFIDNRIDKKMRPRVPLLLSGGKIVWIGGYRIDDTVKMGPETTHVVTVRLVQPNPSGDAAATFTCLKPDDG